MREQTNPREKEETERKRDRRKIERRKEQEREGTDWKKEKETRVEGKVEFKSQKEKKF